MENYKNLNFSAEQINQKLAWVGDKSKLATTLQETPVNQFMFTKDQKTLKTIIDANNQIITVETNDMITEPGSKLESWNVYVDHLLCINSIACEGTMCSHNYVELGNGSKKDINLNGLYLLYTDCSKRLESDIGYVWQYLPLTGVIKAGSTFVIRGKQTNTIKGSMIKVDSYDMEWDIEFKQNKAAFYLCAGDSFKPLLESNSLGNPWEANLIGYIDSCGFGAEAPAEGNSPLLVNDNWNDIIFVRWFMFETAKQGTKAFAKRKTKDLWTYIDLTKNTTKAGNSIQYYYSDNIKLKYTPKASYLGKDFFTISTLFRQDIPNYVNLTFGRQATDSGSGATRCFNWISVGYYDEYVEIRKQGEEWSKHYSIIEKDSSNTANINKFINYYKRYKWIAPDGTFVTTHKDLKLWKQTEEFPTGCEKCIVYTHDAPFSIVTYDFMNTSTTARAGSKLNTINNNGTYRFSRLFKKMGIRLVMAGHKHTYGISKPIYDAPIEYLEGNKASSAVDILSGEITTDMSRKPVIQVLRQDQVQVNNFARYEVVENITAPTYVTCQATEYKLISNKEQPSGDAYRIPWLLAYFPAATSSSNPKENTAQHKPMYIKYDVSDTNIKITAVQINGIWEVDSSSTKYDFNNQIENLTIDKMTLSTSTEEDLAIQSRQSKFLYP